MVPQPPEGFALHDERRDALRALLGQLLLQYRVATLEALHVFAQLCSKGLVELAASAGLRRALAEGGRLQLKLLQLALQDPPLPGQALLLRLGLPRPLLGSAHLGLRLTVAQLQVPHFGLPRIQLLPGAPQLCQLLGQRVALAAGRHVFLGLCLQFLLQIARLLQQLLAMVEFCPRPRELRLSRLCDQQLVLELACLLDHLPVAPDLVLKLLDAVVPLPQQLLKVPAPLKGLELTIQDHVRALPQAPVLLHLLCQEASTLPQPLVLLEQHVAALFALLVVPLCERGLGVRHPW
mmetsp:Transcript_4001/g.11148  ORF Transcript_4001/g.11148 Transcript_4001/m.11148 type:complete len:293 (-) Transcript_4001:696-1574(-)